MPTILTVIGARPQFIKASVVSKAIAETDSLKEIIVHTGQHYDENMSDIFFTEMDIPKPEINLHLGSGSHGIMTGEMLKGIEEILLNKKPDLLLVYGDTNSTLAGALAASKLNIPIAHVEAGLLSFMMTMPEEQNRRLTDHLSTWLFCPTSTAIKNLKVEGIKDTKDTIVNADNKRVSITGDIMYDASIYYRSINQKKVTDKDFILLTIHRQENTDDLHKLSSIVKAINFINKKVIFPVHPRTRKLLSQSGLNFKDHVTLIDPVGYFDMISYEESCDFVLTDSGGVQKEAYFFKKPCITLRDSTEWIELVEHGWNTLTGANTQKIIDAIKNAKRVEQNNNDSETFNATFTNVHKLIEYTLGNSSL